MDDWTRVLLYGTFDGFAYSTDDFPRTVVVLDSGERVEVPEECVVSADRMINKNKIKLKDVIARIKELDLGTQKVWLNEILNELGSDYGTLKYKDGYEQGKLEGEWVGRQLKDAEKIRQELNKPTVPQIVADYIKYTKDAEWDLQEAMDDVAYEDNKDLRKWFNNNIELFARAWIDGYTVEKEPKYTVKFKATKQYLCNDDLGPHFDPSFRTNFTKSDLEKLDLGWVFDCEGMEVEKVGK
jgi:hypothetical protein|nr:MAG TPA: Protein of unknown function (DUF1642) [Caudoviricetes sp.]